MRIDPHPHPAAMRIDPRPHPAASCTIDRPIPAASCIIDRPIPAASCIIGRDPTALVSQSHHLYKSPSSHDASAPRRRRITEPPMHRTLAALLLTLTACSDNLDPAPFNLSETQPDQAIDTPDQALEPDLPPLMPAMFRLAAGAAHTCALRDDALYCWGRGSGLEGASATPRLVPGMGSGVTAVAAGGAHTCAVKAGALWCWGANDKGQLGVGGETPASSAPLLVPGMDEVSEVSAGVDHTCAVQRGDLYCWGSNAKGQLGDPARSSDRADKPGRVPGLSLVLRVSAGSGHTCATNDAEESCQSGTCWITTVKLWCWGDNLKGQVGDEGIGQDVRAPQRVSRIYRPPKPFAGHSHTCTLESGGVRCWGDNNEGLLGDRIFDDSPSPKITPVGLERGVGSISLGDRHMCALFVSSIMCWGANDKGQLGDVTGYRDTPTRVESFGEMYGFTAIAAGANHTCAARNEVGEVWCWGDNAAGQLGDATAAPTALPVRVNLP
jgi:alpha-tubulin suppressor-like RCC1 family protein